MKSGWLLLEFAKSSRRRGVIKEGADMSTLPRIASSPGTAGQQTLILARAKEALCQPPTMNARR